MRGNKVCYCCGNKATSREHAPPKLMFKGFDCDSITVPSCAVHNSKKSGNDQAIVSALVFPYYSMLINDYITDQLTPERLKAIEEIKPAFERVKRKVMSMPFLLDPPKGLVDLPNTSYIAASAEIRGWIRQLSAALLFDGTQAYDETINWGDAGVWSAEFYSAPAPMPLDTDYVVYLAKKRIEEKSKLDKLDWREGWSSSPRPYPEKIFYFNICVGEDYVIYKHVFYEGFSWYCWTRISEKTVSLLKKRI